MRLRTFTAPDMPSAIKMVREAMGNDAIIIASEAHKGKKGINVTAAIDGKDEFEAIKPPRPAKATTSTRENSEIDQLRFEVQNILRFHNMPELFIAKLMQKAVDKELASIQALYRISSNRDEKNLHRLALEKLTSAYFRFEPLEFNRPGLRLMLVGPPGIGKTFTIAKTAAQLTMEKQPVAVVTTDNKRAGGIEQLQAFTNILGIELKVATSRTELLNFIESTSPRTQLLVDTAGCNPYEYQELRELKDLASIDGIEPVLVISAGGDSLEAIDMVEAFAALPAKRLMITRTDTARRFGGVLAAAAASGLAFSNVSSSSSIIDPLQPLDGALLAQLLLRYQLQSR